jgi:hypothetical protein
MRHDELDFSFTFIPQLKSREEISVTLDFILACTKISTFCQFVLDTDGSTEEIRRQLSHEAEAITNRWVLQFPSADAAIDPSAYHSLAIGLRIISPPGFEIRRAVVRQIKPLSPRPDPPKPLCLPSPSRPPRHQPSRSERETLEFLERLHAAAKVERGRSFIRQEFKDIWNVSDFGTSVEEALDTFRNRFFRITENEEDGI